MSIKEQGYMHWEGHLRERKFPWRPIARTGIKLAFRKKYFKFFFLFSLVPAVAYLGGIYISERLEDFQAMLSGVPQFLQVNPAFFKSYFTNDFLLFMMVMIMVLCGAELIADDLKHNSLQLYFARPLRKKDYLFGKASILFFFLLILTLVPGVIFIAMKLLFSGSISFIRSYPWLLLAVIAYSLFVTAFFSCFTLFLSSLSKNRRYVAVLIFMIYIFSDIMYGIFYGIFRNPYFSLLSLKANIQQVGTFLFLQRSAYGISWLYSFLVLLSLCGFFVWVLQRKIRGVEIIK